MFKKVLPTLTMGNLFVVAIDSNENNELYGRWSNPYVDREYSFTSIIDLLSQIQGFFDINEFTQRSNQLRTFSPKKRKILNDELRITKKEPNFGVSVERGNKFNFKIAITSRINSTWQGIMVDLNNTPVMHFNSALELLMYIQSTI